MSGEVLLQSTSVDVTFSAYLASDHVSAATGKTIAITISKNKGAFGNPSAGATSATEIASGVYYVNLSTTDTATLGPLVLRGAVATIDDVIVHYRVRAATNMDLTALPAAVVSGVGGLLTAPTTANVGLADLARILGTVVATPATAGVLDINVKNMNNVAATAITTIKAVQGLAVDGVITTLTNLPAITANWLTAAGIAAGALNGKGDWLLSSAYTAPSNLTAAQIATGIFQDTAAGDFTVAGSIGKSIMNGVALGTGLTVNDITTKTGYALTSAYDYAKGTVAMTESYAADGATATPVQMHYQLWSFLAEANLSGTTLTAKKLDGSTTAMTFTVDSATAPTTITRAT